MADTSTAGSPAPRKRRRWPWIIAGVFGLLIALIVVAYFVGTSSSFFKSVILPKASAALNAKITVSDATISPFHEVVLHNLKVETTGPQPLLTAQEVLLRYSLMDILHGNIHVEELTLASPTVSLVENTNNTSNLEPILQKVSAAPSKPAAQPSKPAQIDIGKLQITDGKVLQTKLYGGGKSDVTELSHFNLTATDLKNGQTGKITLGADFGMQNNPPAPAASGSLQGNVNGAFNIGLTADLKPASIQGDTKVAVTQAEGALAQAAAFGTTFTCDVTPTEIKQVALRFAKGDSQLGELLVSGPFNIEKTEGRLDIKLFGVDKNLLNLAGASSGLDFGPTTINSTNQVQLANGGKTITTAGQFYLNHFQITRTNETTPPLDLNAQYNVTVDSAASNAVLHSFTLNGLQNGKQIITGQLTSPMTVSWGAANGGVGNSTLDLAVTHLDLANWKAFVGNVAPAGDVNMKLQLVSRQAAKQLTFDLNSTINNLTVIAGSNQLAQLVVTLALHGECADMKQFKFPSYQLTLAQQDRPLLNASGSGTDDLATTNADVQLDAQLMLPALLQAVPQPGMKVSSGNVEIKAHVLQQDKNQNVTGDFSLANFTGQIGSNTFQDFGATASLDVGMTPEQVQIRKINGQLMQGNHTGGSFNLAGTYGLSNKVAQLTAQLTDFNQNGLGPFLAPMLSGKQLTSVDLNGDGSVNYDPAAASAIKADLQITNLVVHDPTGQFPSSPLALGLRIDTDLNKQVVQIHQCQLALTPTSRANNQLQLTGTVDMTHTNAIQGNLKLAADALDLTTYYDLFGGQKTAAAKPSPTPARPSAAPAETTSAGQQTPQTTQLPLQNFTADAAIGALYLHEVAITNFVMTTKIDGGHVVLDPCKLALNGAPVNAAVDLDLGVPGYKYNLNFGAQAVPLAPLVDTFQPDRKGQLGGTFSANAKIAGTGTSGTDLKKYLNGQFDFGSTNLNLEVINIRSPVLKALINVVAFIPELIRNPTSALGGLAGTLVPGKTAGTTGSLSSELEKSPINSIVASGTVGDGKLALQNALVQSPAFEAQANGTVMLADILTNSTLQIPVTVLLSQSLAERFNVAPANEPTNAAYVALPNFLTMTGTVGQPNPKINYEALAGTVFRGIGGILSGAGVGGNAGKILQGLGNLGGALGGKTTSSNAPAASQPRKGLGGLLNGLGGALGGQTSTSTNAPPATNQSPVNNLLRGLFK